MRDYTNLDFSALDSRDRKITSALKAIRNAALLILCVFLLYAFAVIMAALDPAYGAVKEPQTIHRSAD